MQLGTKIDNELSHSDLIGNKILIHEPFAKFLGASPEEFDFEISLLEVVRFAGHACPSMIGAFLMSEAATNALFPADKRVQRGNVMIEIPQNQEQGPTGPISNVFSMIFGSWESSGFGGLGGEHFRRKNLLKYNCSQVPSGHYRFTNIATGVSVDIAYRPSGFDLPPDYDQLSFPENWRVLTHALLLNRDKCLSVQWRSEA